MIYILGTKSDLEENRTIENEVALAMSRDFGVSYEEVSAKNNVNIQKFFEKIAHDLTEKYLINVRDNLYKIIKIAMKKFIN